jgi:hypothetical protein
LTEDAGRRKAESCHLPHAFALEKCAMPPHRQRMKALFLLGFLAIAGLPAPAADTAYSALRVVGKRDGQEALNHVLELRGRSGAPQPAVWKVVLDEPRARGGVREIEVQRGKIISERTPTSASAGSPLNFNQLNLDSEGAFTIANQEAQKAGAPFDRVDYVLKSGTGGGAPVWELELFDGRNGRTGSIEIAADSGAVLRRQLSHTPRGDDDHAYLDDRRQGRTSDNVEDDYDREHSALHTLPDFLNRVGRHFQKRGRQLENFFTGR